MNKIIERIIPGAVYKKGFIIRGKTYPFYSFLQPNSENSWSDYLTKQLENPSKTHFIDIYNRKLALDLIKDKLVHGCCYLDAGCSSGYMLEDVVSGFPWINAMGIDCFSAGLFKCHNQLPDAPLFQMSLVDCQFPDNLFDAVTCLNVLEHIKDDTVALKQLFRIIAPGGRLVVTVPMGRNLYDMYDQVHYHVRRYEIGELVEKICLSGFKIIKINYFGVFVYPAFYFVKQMNRIRFRRAGEDLKKQIVFKQIRDSSRSLLMDKLSSIEYSMGKLVPYPFGIRAYAVCERPA